MNVFELGKKTSETIKVSDKMVRQFAEMSGDNNPIHLDENFAAKTRFKRRIAHGMISAALISRSLTKNIGVGVYMTQSLRFKNPIFVDETVKINLEITKVRSGRGIAVVSTEVIGENGKICAEGEAMIMHGDSVSST